MATPASADTHLSYFFPEFAEKVLGFQKEKEGTCPIIAAAMLHYKSLMQKTIVKLKVIFQFSSSSASLLQGPSVPLLQSRKDLVNI